VENPLGVLFNLYSAQGRYIAMYEGDDYWSNPLNLQKQVDFLGSKSDYVITYYNTAVINSAGKITMDSNYQIYIREMPQRRI
jgi:hypothetical protein